MNIILPCPSDRRLGADERDQNGTNRTLEKGKTNARGTGATGTYNATVILELFSRIVHASGRPTSAPSHASTDEPAVYS